MNTINPLPSTLPEYTVTELSLALKRVVETGFSRVRVRGEISGLKRHTSGHVYFALKDQDAVLDGVCWRGSYQGLSLTPQEGMEVIATGRLTTYPGRSKYQIIVEAMELAGEGAGVGLARVQGARARLLPGALARGRARAARGSRVALRARAAYGGCVLRRRLRRVHRAAALPDHASPLDPNHEPARATVR